MQKKNQALTSRTQRPLSKDFDYTPNSSSRTLKSTPRSDFTTSREAPEVVILRKEIFLLKNNLSHAQKELEELKAIHFNETTEMKSTLDSMKRELQKLKSQKLDPYHQDYGIDEYRSLAQEVIRLRTEVDRLNDQREKKKTS